VRRLHIGVHTQLKHLRQHLSALAHGLNTVSPLATLDRGYAIVTTADGQILHNAQQTQHGDRVIARLAHGRLFCIVDEPKT